MACRSASNEEMSGSGNGNGNGRRPKGTGRKKIGMKTIESIKNRRVTFCKRKGGLFKKAEELCQLTGCNVSALAFSTSGKPCLYGNLELLEQAAASQAAAAENHSNVPSASDFQGMGQCTGHTSISMSDSYMNFSEEQPHRSMLLANLVGRNEEWVQPLQTVLSTPHDGNLFKPWNFSYDSSGHHILNYSCAYGCEMRQVGSRSSSSSTYTNDGLHTYTPELMAPGFPTCEFMLDEEQVVTEDEELNRLMQQKQMLELQKQSELQKLMGAQNYHTQAFSFYHPCNGTVGGF